MIPHATRPVPLLALAAALLAASPGCRCKDVPTGGTGGPAAGAKNIPQPVAGRFSAAFVYVGPVGDGGWSYAHDLGRKHLEQKLGVHTAYVESVSEGAEAEQVVRNLARKGFNLIVGTSFGYMDAMEAAAREYPRTTFVHISGHKSNGRNFGNLFGAMESMKYLAGMIAGARATADKQTKLGYIAPFPIPEVIRLGNAVMRGARRTCPRCTMEVRWINSWFDPTREREAAESLLKAGVHVVITGADTPGPILAAKDAGKWGIGYDSANACQVAPERCLTTPYWTWGPVYVDLVRRIRSGTYSGSSEYLDVVGNVVGLYGFMPGETLPRAIPTAVMVDVPPPPTGAGLAGKGERAVHLVVKDLLARMQAGAFTRFDVFAGPLVDNQGKQLLATGQKLTQQDLEGLPGCTLCMRWLAEGIIGQIPPQK
jgi:basic membrane protein A and related proteins